MQMTHHLYYPLINDNHSTGMNDNINKELRNVHNWLLAQRLSLKYMFQKQI